MTTEDTRLLDDLRDLWWLADPPPPGLTATMIAAVAAADLDHEWELLVLVRDSANEPAAQVRGLATARMLYFTAAEGWSLDAEIDGDQVRGQVLDFVGDLGAWRSRSRPPTAHVGDRRRRGRLLRRPGRAHRVDPLHDPSRAGPLQQPLGRALSPPTRPSSVVVGRTPVRPDHRVRVVRRQGQDRVPCVGGR